MSTSEHSSFSVDTDDLIEFTQELIRCQSWNPPGNEAEVATLVAENLQDFGVEVETVPVEPSRDNVYGRLRGDGSGPGNLVLVSHLDTVPPGNKPWNHDPLGGTLESGRIYGRGSADMKGGLAAIVFAAGALAQSGFELSSDLIIVGTVGEEVNCIGAEAMINAGLLEDASAAAIPEPSGLDLYIAHKGALWVKVETEGRVAHGAHPDLGVNAILQMEKTIQQIVAADWDAPAHSLLGKPTLNIGTIQGGTKTNMVPDHCELTIDFRSLPSQTHSEILEKLRHILDELRTQNEDYEATLEVVNDKAAMSTPVDSSFVQTAQGVGESLWGKPLKPGGVSYYTDASVLGPASDIPIFVLGPGEADQAHQADEWVAVDKLVQATHFYSELTARWLG